MSCLFFSCNEDDNEVSIVGNWEKTEAGKIQSVDCTITTVMEIHNDGAFQENYSFHAQDSITIAGQKMIESHYTYTGRYEYDEINKTLQITYEKEVGRVPIISTVTKLNQSELELTVIIPVTGEISITSFRKLQ